MITSNQQILICIIIGIIIIFLFYKQSENFATNTEAISNIASLYNAANLTATNINATGNVEGGGIVSQKDALIKGNLTATNINATGSVIATGNVEGGGIISQKDAWIKGNVTVDDTLNVNSRIIAAGDITCRIGSITATGGNIRAGGNIQAGGTIFAPNFAGKLMSPETGNRQLVIDDSGHVYVANSKGEYLTTISEPI